MLAEDSIEVFQDVSFKFPCKEAEVLRKRLSDSLVGPWEWAEDWETTVRSRITSEEHVFAFKRSPIEGNKSSYLCLMGTNVDDWSIPNVVPQEIGNRLSIHQYNEILNDFMVLVLNPALRTLQTTAETSTRHLSLYDMFGKKTAESLRAFLSVGVSCGSAFHDSDVQRLNRFICNLFDSNADFDCSLLERFLREVRGWPEQHADAFATRVNQGLELLKYRGLS